MQVYALLATVLVIVCQTSGYNHFPERKCPAVRPVYISRGNFGGRWYEVGRSMNHMGGPENQCGSIIHVDIHEEEQGWYLSINGTADGETMYSKKQTVAKTPTLIQSFWGAFRVEMGLNPEEPANARPNYFVLHVDKINALMYFCEPFGKTIIEQAYLLSRYPRPNPADRQVFERKLKLKGVDMKLVDIPEPCELSSELFEDEYEDGSESFAEPPRRLLNEEDREAIVQERCAQHLAERQMEEFTYLCYRD